MANGRAFRRNLHSTFVGAGLTGASLVSGAIGQQVCPDDACLDVAQDQLTTSYLGEAVEGSYTFAAVDTGVAVVTGAVSIDRESLGTVPFGTPG